MTASDPWTPTQSRLIAVLADGLPHAREELLAVIDAHATMQNLKPHLSVIRKKLRASGQDVVPVYHRRTHHYQHVILLTSSTAT